METCTRLTTAPCGVSIGQSMGMRELQARITSHADSHCSHGGFALLATCAVSSHAQSGGSGVPAFTRCVCHSLAPPAAAPSPPPLAPPPAGSQSPSRGRPPGRPRMARPAHAERAAGWGTTAVAMFVAWPAGEVEFMPGAGGRTGPVNRKLLAVLFEERVPQPLFCIPSARATVIPQSPKLSFGV